MKYILFAFVGMLLFACSKPDKEAIIGKWSVKEQRSEGKLVFSNDEATYKKILDSIYTTIPANPGFPKPSKKEFIDNYMKGLAQAKKSYFEFTKTELKMSAQGNSSAQKYTMNDKKKTLTIQAEGPQGVQKIDVKYSLDGDMLVMDITQDKSKLTLERKK